MGLQYHQLDTLYKSVRLKMHAYLGSQGSKGHFHQKAISPSDIHGMVMGSQVILTLDTSLGS